MHTAKLTYMAGAPDHSRDSFEFLVHDCKHMENFHDPTIHTEQVGFFRAMCLLGSSSADAEDWSSWRQVIDSAAPKRYFLDVCAYDSQLWLELEYVISDMYVYRRPVG